MATAAKHAAPPPIEASTSAGKSRLAAAVGWCRAHWLVCLIVGSVAIHAVGLTLVAMRTKPVVEPLAPEVSLGQFQFEPVGELTSSVRGATFRLHIGLTDPEDRPLRAKLSAVQFRLRQGVEELLREAQAADFEDPSLADLKRQLQQRINETLGAKAVAEVIITDLAIRRGETPLQVGATR